MFREWIRKDLKGNLDSDFWCTSDFYLKKCTNPISLLHWSVQSCICLFFLWTLSFSIWIQSRASLIGPSSSSFSFSTNFTLKNSNVFHNSSIYLFSKFVNLVSKYLIFSRTVKLKGLGRSNIPDVTKI